MEYPVKYNIPFEEIANGALTLVLLREVKTWEELCRRYMYADPDQLETNVSTIELLKKLFELRDLGLITFYDEDTGDGKKPVGEIEETNLCAKLRAAFGIRDLADAVLLSKHAKGLAVVPVFGRPPDFPVDQKIDIFVLMPFKAKLENFYSNHIKMVAEELGLAIRRADEIFSPEPFMQKVWNCIHKAQLIIADCTERNPNVFYEIGIAHTVGKKVILITQSDKDIPSDIKHFDYIAYTYKPEDVEILIGKLRDFIKSQFGL